MFKYLDLSYWEIMPILIKEFKNDNVCRFWFKYTFYLLSLITTIIFFIITLSIQSVFDILKCIGSWIFYKLNIVIDFNQEIHIPKFIKSFFKKLIFKGSSNV